MRFLFAAALLCAACSSTPDLRPALKVIDERALATWERRLTTPSPAKTAEEAELLRKSDLEVCQQARKLAQEAQGPK